MRAEISGIRDAMNAIAFGKNGDHAFLYDREARWIVRLETSTGIYSPLRWDGHFKRKRWLCYALFTHEERLSVLFFNVVKRMFCLITFRFGPKDELLLVQNGKNYLPMDSPVDRLAYCAQERGGVVELIFYENKPLSPTVSQKFWFFAFDVQTLKFSRQQSGSLPTSMSWELPFVSENGLHFIHWKRGGGYLATWSMDEETPEWSTSDVLPDDETAAVLSRRAVWANCWERGFGIFVVSKKEDEKTKCEVWLLDVRLSAWKHVTTAATIEGDATNFAVRLVADDLLLHCDLPAPAVPTFFRVRGLLPAARVAAASAISALEEGGGIGLADVICPICLDAYSDPKTLICGHSLCADCLATLAAKVPNVSAIRCPTCRMPSRVPSSGLPTNYGLKEAIEMLSKVRRSQTFDQRCNTCRLACIDEELWRCLDCDRGQTALCANCVLLKHDNHSVRRELDFKVDLAAIEESKREFEREAAALFDRFNGDLGGKFRALVFDKILHIHADCLDGRSAKEAEIRAAKCLTHFQFVFEEILQSTDSFINSLEESLLNEHDCKSKAPTPPTEFDRTTSI